MSNPNSETDAKSGHFKPIDECLPREDEQTNSRDRSERLEGANSNDDLEGMTDAEIKELVDSQIYKKADSGFPKPMDPAAFPGTIGKIVDLVTEHSELCREAVLVQSLVIMGNIVGRGPYIWQESTHHSNEFVGIAGKSSNGAKGGSIRAVKTLMRAVDSSYVMEKCQGFQSGEAVVDAIRDEYENIKDNGDTDTIEGVEDKRLCIIDEELSRLLKLGARQGSILSEIMRLAFDNDVRLTARAKKHPAITSFPYISMIGHITPEELREVIKNSDIHNGFANRILWCASRRSGKVPRPKLIDWREYPEIIAELRAVINEFGPHRTETIEGNRRITFAPAAETTWDEFYYQNETEAEKIGGVVGSMIARGKAHVLRLCCIYAMLDQSDKIQTRHIKSARAVWDYCKASAKWLFGDKSGNRNADDILWSLKRYPDGLTRTQIANEILRKNVSATEIERALSELRKAGLADFTTKRGPKGGRPAETWFFVG